MRRGLEESRCKASKSPFPVELNRMRLGPQGTSVATHGQCCLSGKLIRDSMPAISTGGWKTGTPLLSMGQNSKLLQRRYCLFINTLFAQVRYREPPIFQEIVFCFLISVYTTVYHPISDSSKGPTWHTGFTKKSLRPVILTFLQSKHGVSTIFTEFPP